MFHVKGDVNAKRYGIAGERGNERGGEGGGGKGGSEGGRGGGGVHARGQPLRQRRVREGYHAYTAVVSQGNAQTLVIR